MIFMTEEYYSVMHAFNNKNENPEKDQENNQEKCDTKNAVKKLLNNLI